MGFDELERIADERVGLLARVYARVPRERRRQAYMVYLDLARGRITYWEAVRRLRWLARG